MTMLIKTFCSFLQRHSSLFASEIDTAIMKVGYMPAACSPPLNTDLHPSVDFPGFGGGEKKCSLCSCSEYDGVHIWGISSPACLIQTLRLLNLNEAPKDVTKLWYLTPWEWSQTACTVSLCETGKSEKSLLDACRGQECLRASRLAVMNWHAKLRAKKWVQIKALAGRNLCLVNSSQSADPAFSSKFAEMRVGHHDRTHWVIYFVQTVQKEVRTVLLFGFRVWN